MSTTVIMNYQFYQSVKFVLPIDLFRVHFPSIFIGYWSQEKMIKFFCQPVVYSQYFPHLGWLYVCQKCAESSSQLKRTGETSTAKHFTWSWSTLPLSDVIRHFLIFQFQFMSWFVFHTSSSGEVHRPSVNALYSQLFY